MKRLALLAAVVLVCASPAQGFSRPLSDREMRAGVSGYMHSFDRTASYTRKKCRLGRRRAWCRLIVRPPGCGCSVEEPEWYDLTVAVEAYRWHLRASEEFWAKHVWLRR